MFSTLEDDVLRRARFNFDLVCTGRTTAICTLRQSSREHMVHSATSILEHLTGRLTIELLRQERKDDKMYCDGLEVEIAT
jgi:hypothetical protein